MEPKPVLPLRGRSRPRPLHWDPRQRLPRLLLWQKSLYRFLRPDAPGPSQSKQPVAPQTAQSNDDLELAFNGHCRECHSFEKNDNRLGPSLFGVVGRKAGTAPNFAYSDSVKGSGITWDEPTLDKWITNPNALIPGNNMGTIFGGVADPAERAKIIAFLKQDTHASPPASNSAGQPPPAKQ